MNDPREIAGNAKLQEAYELGKDEYDNRPIS